MKYQWIVCADVELKNAHQIYIKAKKSSTHGPWFDLWLDYLNLKNITNECESSKRNRHGEAVLPLLN